LVTTINVRLRDRGMGSNRAEVRGSQRLQALIHHLHSSIPSDSNEPNSKFTVWKKRAAVLICVFEGADGNLRVFLTQRASSLSTHSGNSLCKVSLFFFYFSIITEMGCISGEVALPGGKREEGDADDVQTALREAKEEIGLDPSLVSVITLLPPFHTKVFVSLFNFILVLTSFAFI